MSQILFVTRPHLIRANQAWTWPVTLKVHSIHWKFICWSVSFVFTLLRISVLWQISKTITILYEQNFFIFQNSAFKLFSLFGFSKILRFLTYKHNKLWTLWTPGRIYVRQESSEQAINILASARSNINAHVS